MMCGMLSRRVAQKPFGVVEEERVTPCGGWCGVLLARRNGDHSRWTADVLDDLCLCHAAIIALQRKATTLRR
jgi:hypothetical protein